VLQDKITNLYQHLTANNNAFFMDADDIYAMEVSRVDYPLTGLVTNGFSTHITVSPNYFQFNPILTSEDIHVEQELIYADNVLNILVPESLSSIYDEINERFLDYFDFYRFRIYENVYGNTSNDSWNPSMQKDLEIHIIPVKTGQLYFTLSPNIRRDDGNKILDPVVVVYTDNFHPSSTFTKMSRCFYFQYDDSNEMTPDDYLAKIVGMNDFVFANSVWKDVSDRVSKLQGNYFTTIFLAIFIIIGYFVTNFNLIENYFMHTLMQKKYATKVAHRRYYSALLILISPAFFAILLLVFVAASRWGRFIPTISLQGIILIGMFLVGIDILYFIVIGKLFIKSMISKFLSWRFEMKNTIKRFIALVLSVALFSGFSMEAKAAPASGLTKVEITDLTVDDYGEIHVEVKFTSTEF